MTISDDLNTPIALTVLEGALAVEKGRCRIKRAVIEHMDAVLGLGLFDITRQALRGIGQGGTDRW
ncbi:MAG: hypothetical protein R3E18_01800 [Sphingomonadaceae bacterium]